MLVALLVLPTLPTQPAMHARLDTDSTLAPPSPAHFAHLEDLLKETLLLLPLPALLFAQEVVKPVVLPELFAPPARLVTT